MTPELWARIQSIFDEALAREGPARAAFVAEACAGDEELRREVESLLAAHGEAGSFLDRTPGGGLTEPGEAPSALAPGTRIDHFEVIGPLGAGGMGFVVAARDLDLDRKVAIKLVGAGGGEHRDERQARLLREAQALAKLSHPNVITVFETGTFRDDVYLAMELVEGGTLRDWLAVARRWREAVETLLPVGRGLAAAHAAGLVHRDFKPENVLVGRDGRMRVTDFGLVRTSGAEPPREPTTDSTTPVDPFALTLTGAVMGTPRYMAPEQFAGAAVDARADQFAFGAVLHEALYGVGPFEGTTRDELADNVRGGRIVAPPAGRKVPGWLRRVCLRALAAAPPDRYPSMSALLAELGRDDGPMRRRLALVGAGVAAAVGLVVWRLATPGVACGGGETKLAGIWDAPARDRLHAAFAATGKPHAEETFALVARGLDAYVRDFATMHRAACVATRDGEQSAHALDLRMECLRQRLVRLGATTALLGGADAELLAKAAGAVEALPPIDGCADLARLSARVPPPEEPKLRARVEAARGVLAEAQARLDAGQYALARGLALAALAVERAAPHPPLEAEADYIAGRAQDFLGDTPGAVRTFSAAALAAIRGAHLELETDAHLELLNDQGVYLGNWDAAATELATSKALVSRLDDPNRRALLLGYEGDYLAARNKPAEARANYLEALALEEKLHPTPHRRLGRAITELLVLELGQGQLDAALAHGRRALVVLEAALGPAHPDVALAHENVAAVLSERGELRAAIAETRLALAVREETLGPDSPFTAVSYLNLGQALDKLGSYADAAAALEHADAIAQKMGYPHPNLAELCIALGDAELYLRRFDAAAAAYARALAALDKRGALDGPIAAVAHFARGNLELERGRPADALAAFQRSLAVLEHAEGADPTQAPMAQDGAAAALLASGHVAEARDLNGQALAKMETLVPQDHRSLAPFLARRAEILVRAGARDEAVAALERAVALYQRGEGDPRASAGARFALARVLWDRAAERPRALELASAARAELDGLGDAAAAERKPIEAWLAARR